MSAFAPTLLSIDEVRPHPRNYRIHPADEVEHIMESIREHGFYRNIVVSADGTILAGHGVVLAARRLGLTQIPAIRTDYQANDPRALKLLVGDNEIQHLAESDDRVLTELLKELNETDVESLLGTGYDEMMLANLLYVSRPASEIASRDAASQWVGMPEYEAGIDTLQIVVSFASEEDCQEFCRITSLGSGKTALHGAKKSYWWPPRLAKDDNLSLRFTSSAKKKEGV